MSKSKIWLAIFLVVVLVASLALIFLHWLPLLLPANKTYVASGHPEWGPIMWQQGDQIVGVGPDLVKKIFTDLGINIEVKYLGLWDEVQAKAKSGEADVLVAAYKTDERTNYMSYSVPYTVDPIALVVKKGRSFSYTKWDDLIGKKGVLMTGDSYGQTFDDYIKAKLTTVRVATAEEAIERLEKGEVDYFVYALYSLEKLITEKGLIDAVEVLPRYVASENFYITISHQSPLEKYLGQVNDLIEKYRRDGTIDSLITKNKALFQASLNKAEE